jgi:signal transduction histidine kinase
LAIAKSVAEAHGDTITAASAGLGTGSTFSIALRLAWTALNFSPKLARLW